MEEVLDLDERIMIKTYDLLEKNSEKYFELARQLMKYKSFVDSTDSHNYRLDLEGRELHHFTKTHGFHTGHRGISYLNRSRKDKLRVISFRLANCEAIVLLEEEELAKQ